MGSNNITCFVNSIVKNLSLNLCKENIHDLEKCVSYPIMFVCQLRVMKIKIGTTEASAFGPIFAPGHLQGKKCTIYKIHFWTTQFKNNNITFNIHALHD